jgi:hypothetical protein
LRLLVVLARKEGMYIELTRPVAELDLPEAIRHFLRAFPESLVDRVNVAFTPNVDPPYQDWTFRFRLAGESIVMAYGDRPDLGLRIEEYPRTANFGVVLPDRGAPPEVWAEVVKTAVRLHLRQEKEWASRRLDRLG